MSLRFPYTFLSTYLMFSCKMIIVTKIQNLRNGTDSGHM